MIPLIFNFGQRELLVSPAQVFVREFIPGLHTTSQAALPVRAVQNSFGICLVHPTPFAHVPPSIFEPLQIDLEIDKWTPLPSHTNAFALRNTRSMLIFL